ncbi:MFS-type transporter 1 [Cladobotryum mycophilum]|uniref:MFS-type transporter 1 n=1 Tax=Cladobotryum mycophilum TaxID=491253 RepID=A0ABR0T370_9HYPO
MEFNKLTASHGGSSLASFAFQTLPPASSSNPKPSPPAVVEQKAHVAAGTVQETLVTPREDPALHEAVLESDPPSSLLVSPSPPPPELPFSKARAIVVIVTLSGITLLNAIGSGILVTSLPRIAKEVGLPQSLLLWPAAVYSLAAGCTLLIFGSIADVVGPKRMWLTGSLLYVIFTLAVGLAKTAMQIILFRAVLGVAIAMCLPTAVSLITNTFPRGDWRNTAFAVNGACNPLGYAVGLVLGGIFTSTIGWRWGYYTMAIINVGLTAASFWVLPSVNVATNRHWKTRIIHEVDWLGAVMLSAALGMLLYVLAMTSSSYRKISDTPQIAVLTVSLALLIAFPFWMDYQTRRGKPAFIPNKLWRNSSFTTVCVGVFLSWAFQEIQHLSALQSSVRFLPHVISGAAANVVTGLLISKVQVQTLVVVSAVIAAVAAPLMATISVGQSYWFSPFWALFLSPVNGDVLFTVSGIVISNAYPPELQSLAGSVFNEMSQFGNSVGLAITAAVAASVTEHSTEKTSSEALMQGYRAAFWTVFAGCVTVVVVAWFGLRKGGIVGKKDD